MTQPRFGLMLLQSAPFAELRDRWRRAEELGFDSVWVADHTPSQYPGLIAFEAWTLLGAMAATTSRVRLGTLVSSIAMRHPYQLAYAASTVDHISGGRLELGLGTGGAPADEESVDSGAWTGRDRLARLDEQLGILDRLLRGEPIAHAGAAYRSTGHIEAPASSPRPPLVVAANGPLGLEVVARHADVWNSLGGQPMRSTGQEPLTLAQSADQARLLSNQLDAACAAAGRDPRSVGRQVLCYRASPFESIEQFEELAGTYLEIGMDELVFYWPADPRTFEARADLEAVMERVATDVIPRLRRTTG